MYIPSNVSDDRTQLHNNLINVIKLRYIFYPPTSCTVMKFGNYVSSSSLYLLTFYTDLIVKIYFIKCCPKYHVFHF
jgi:hypothetical protein